MTFDSEIPLNYHQPITASVNYTMIISKSEYIMFLKHPAWLWLKKHDKSKLPEPDAKLQSLFDAGHLFEEYAEKLFPNGIKLGFKTYEEYLNLPYRTQQVLENGTRTVFQGRMEANNTTCIFDVLNKVGENEYDLIEIKSSSRAKTDHEYDLAFQLLVLESAGVKIRKVKVLHVNKDFKRKGKINTKELTATTDITQKVRALEAKTIHNIKQAFEVIESSEMPSISPRYVGLNAHNEWMEIYKNIHGELGSHHIYNISSPNALALGQLEDLHIESMRDIPEEFNLKPKQKWQVTAHKTGKRYINKEKIKEFIKGLKFPLYFLDYETLSGVIPPLDGLKPFQQLPFQYSLHILDSSKAKLKHKEYLHTENSDPTLSLVNQLKKDIGAKGSVVVWNQYFEKSCNDLMGALQPVYAEFLSLVNKRIKDLMIPFSKGWFVDKEFKGSASLKKVLPVLISELSYHHLDIQQGEVAQRLWMETFLKNGNKQQKEKIIKDLLEYCKLDTLAMVKIWEVLKKIK